METPSAAEEPPTTENHNWAELQRDVLMVIFQKIGTIGVITSVGCVCRSWRKVAKDEPELWRRIDMMNCHHTYDQGSLADMAMIAIDRSNGRLEEFWIEYFGDDDLLKHLCARTSVLKSLRLISCYDVSEEGVAEIARRQPQLEELEITFSSFTEKSTEAIGRECPQLKRFKLNNQWFPLPPPEPDDEELNEDQEALGIAETMHQLHYLQLIGNRLSNVGLRAILDSCPHLESLDIRRCYNIDMDTDMRARCVRLRTLRLPTDSTADYEFMAEASYGVGDCSDTGIYNYDDYDGFDDDDDYENYAFGFSDFDGYDYDHDHDHDDDHDFMFIC